MQVSKKEAAVIYEKLRTDLEGNLAANQLAPVKRNIVLLEQLAALGSIEINDDIQTLIESGKVALTAWVNTLKLGDLVEMFSIREQKWFSIKIVKCSDDDQLTVHYQGWESKYDEVVSRSDRDWAPNGSFIGKPSKPTVKKLPTTPATSEIKAETSVNPIDIGDESEDVTRSGRKTRKVAESSTKATQANDSKKLKSEKTKSEKIEKDHNDWYCSNCGMLEAVGGSDLVLCDGLCRRSFHTECFSEEEMQNYTSQTAGGKPYFCGQCRTAQHVCFLCGKDGIDYLNVLRCSQPYCGKYFHLQCITGPKGEFIRPSVSKPKKMVIEGPEVEAFIANHRALIEAAAPVCGDAASTSIPASSMRIVRDDRLELNMVSFRCPRHCCDTCFEFHGCVDSSDLCHCHYCPRAFHSNCIPPASRYNTVCLVCPLHPLDILPGDAGLLRQPKVNKSSGNLGNGNSKAGSQTGIKTEVGGEGEDEDEDEDKGSEANSHIISFFEQLVLPDLHPDADQIFDNHFRLPLYLKGEIESIPPTFTLISKNNWENFPPHKYPPIVIPDSGCDCTTTCLGNCYNRATRVECCGMRAKDRDYTGPICRVGRDCGNRALQNKEYVKVKVFQEGDMGLGLRAMEAVQAGKLVIEYVGEIIDEDEMVRRMENQRVLTPSDKEFYIMELDDGIYVDGKFQGNLSRYINHSCNPNCELQRWNVHGKIRIGIVAIKDIAVGEALSYDYQFDTQQADVFRCYCGSHNCRGTMAPNKSRRAQIERLLMLSGANAAAFDSSNSTSNSSSNHNSSGQLSHMHNSSSASNGNGSRPSTATSAGTSSSAPSTHLMSAARIETAEERELRLNLVKAAKEKERSQNRSHFVQQELSRSYTGKLLPGDTLQEVRQGPVRTSFPFARRSALFLVRNVLRSQSFTARRAQMSRAATARIEALKAHKGSSSSKTVVTPNNKRKKQAPRRYRDEDEEEEEGVARSSRSTPNKRRKL